MDDITLHSFPLFLYIAPDGPPREFNYGTISSMSIMLTWRNINCTIRNGEITSFNLQYGEEGGTLTTRSFGSGDITIYTVDGLLPFTLYRFLLAGVNINGSGPPASLGPIRTDEDGKLHID